jgi:predicted type IV restriction endonuclease
MPPKYLDDAESRISSNVRKFQQIITQAKSRGVNEADTRDIVKAIIAELLGFDPFFEVTGEFSIKGQFADFAVKQGDNILFFVEVKSIETKLDEKHLFQVIGYAANYGVEWAVLTNANRWIVYRLFSGDEKRTEVVVDIDFLTTSPKDITEAFLKFSKEGFKQALLHKHWSNLQALNPKKLGAMLCSESVLALVKKEVFKQSSLRISEDALYDIVLNQVLRGDIADDIKAATMVNGKKVTPKVDKNQTE